jgi:Asp-tRNA(Asn)/Glu-tRNA(Gln) amidotransferase A subunit family amidase
VSFGEGAYDVERCLARIRERNDTLHAVLHLVEKPEPATSDDGPLAGVPYVLKDTWDTAGIPTTGGSWRHRARVPVSSCHAYEALRRSGAVLLGKSNLCDLAFSTESDNHMRGPVRNPHALDRTAGGSTGGGAAAVADGMAAFDWGTDFGGSIRGPAAFCGVVGLRLATGAWPVGYHHFPRVAPFFWDMCGMGPLTRTVAGSRDVVRAVRSSLRLPSAVAHEVDRDRVVIWEPDAAHRDAWPTFASDAEKALRSAGVEYERANLPTPSEVNALYTEYLAANFEEILDTGELPVMEGLPAVLLALLSNGRLDRRVHPNTAILLAAVFALSAVHRRSRKKTQEKVAVLRARVRAIWNRGSLIISPTTCVLPPRHGHGARTVRSMSFCKLGNLVDATGLAIPFGRFEGAPALSRSLQILGPPGTEEAVLDLGERLEKKQS